MPLKRHVRFALALQSLLATSCAVGYQTTGVLPPPTGHGPVSFYQDTKQRASLTIHIVDRRARRDVQTLTYADSYNALKFTIANAAKLKASKVKTLASTGGTSYAMVFDNLPSDDQARYTLTAGLYRNVTTPTDASDPAFNVLANKVGEGSSAPFSLNPGDNKVVTLTINAVGALSFQSDWYDLDPVNPELTVGDPTVVVTADGVTAANNPEADTFEVSVVDSEGATQSVATASLGVANASVHVTVPTLPNGVSLANFTVVADLLAGNRLLSRRSRQVAVDPTPTNQSGE